MSHWPRSIHRLIHDTDQREKKIKKRPEMQTSWNRMSAEGCRHLCIFVAAIQDFCSFPSTISASAHTDLPSRWQSRLVLLLVLPLFTFIVTWFLFFFPFFSFSFPCHPLSRKALPPRAHRPCTNSYRELKTCVSRVVPISSCKCRTTADILMDSSQLPSPRVNPQ